MLDVKGYAVASRNKKEFSKKYCFSFLISILSLSAQALDVPLENADGSIKKLSIDDVHEHDTQHQNKSLYLKNSCAEDAIDLSDMAFSGYADQDKDGHYQVLDNGCSMYIADNTWVVSDASFTITENTVLEFGYIGNGQGEIHGIGFDSLEGDTARGDRIFKVDWSYPDFGTYIGEKYQGDGSYQVFTVEVGKHFTGDDYHLVFMMDQDVNVGASGYFTNIRLIEKTYMNASL